MKNAVKMLLCILLCLMTLSCAQGVEGAGKLVEMDELKHYPSYVCNAETAWHTRDNFYLIKVYNSFL